MLSGNPDFSFGSSMSESTYIIVGLGNPGIKYDNTRHNVGFMVLDYIARKAETVIESEKWSALTTKCRLAGKNVYFVKPLTYMNLSGKAVVRFVDYYKCPPENLLVIHDDLDMDLGRLKLVKGGGAGGHNGIKSIVSLLGTKEFYRIKFGIGRPGKGGIHPDFPVDKFVLSPFSQDELSVVDSRMASICEGIDFFLDMQPQKAMNLINSVK